MPLQQEGYKAEESDWKLLVGYVSALFGHRFIEASPNMAVRACQRRFVLQMADFAASLAGRLRRPTTKRLHAG